MPFDTIGSPLAWATFLGFVLLMLALDLGVFHRKAHAVSLQEAGLWSIVWVGLAMLFNAGLYVFFGPERALEFTTGFVMEKALAVDNIFVFVVLFAAFGIPAALQHRVLFWGVLGALVLRAGFVLAGGALLQRFHWMMYVFGALLALTGVKLLLQRQDAPDPAGPALVRWLKARLPMTKELHGERFFIRHAGRYLATPLFVALVAVEVTDLVFAVDSIPAVFAITSDPFIVFTSNIFAVLGLRSLYFLLAGVITRFVYLTAGLSLVLVFVGTKMLFKDLFHVPAVHSLGVIAGILGVAIAASWWKPRTGTVPAPATSEGIS